MFISAATEPGRPSINYRGLVKDRGLVAGLSLVFLLFNKIDTVTLSAFIHSVK